MKSARTTAMGIAGILIAIASAIKAFFDADPTTAVDADTINAIVMSLGLIFARDNKVTSEQAGAK